MAKLLIVEDDISFAKLLESFLKRNNYDVIVATDKASAQTIISKEKFDFYLLDYRLPDGSGLDLLALINDAPAIIMTGFKDVRTVVKAMKMGASDYITKPVNPEELLMVIRQSVKMQVDDSRSDTKLPGFVTGQSKKALELQEYIELVGPTLMSVIIEGESGTGKEFVARAIHRCSERSAKPFIPIDCGVLSKELAAGELFGYKKGAFTGALFDKKGQFENASGGTLFLDEIGNLGYEVQVKLLRALQEKVIQPVGSDKLIDVDVRLLTATNENLLDSVERGDFREDLYHRINEFKIVVPPLRERLDDLTLFIDYFVEEANRDLNRDVKNISSEIFEIFNRYEWPGNLRELRNTIRRIVLLSKGSTAHKEMLPEEMIYSLNKISKQENQNVGTLRKLQEETEREQISKVLQEVKGNKSKAARVLNIDRKTLYNKIEKYGLHH
ncbi:sigma-54 dependent transcriptional regulator [Marinilabiliaceae bacterium ANBcel2]|nr:sigma-54 dependent transcriptional regulator [Marinilabiliaceae bacterium ANBcel2]